MKKLLFIICLGCMLAIVNITLLGWFSNRVYLASIDRGYIPMAPLTALCFILLAAGCSLAYFGKGADRFIQAILLMVLFLLTDVFLAYFNIPLVGLEAILVSHPDLFEIVPVGRMSPITFFLFLFASCSLLLIGRKQKALRQAAGIICSLSLLTTLTLLVGYLYQTPLLYGQPVIPVALTTSLCFFLLVILLLICNGTAYFPLHLFFGDKTHVKLLRVFLPMTAFLILAGGALQIYLRNNYQVNEALVISIIALASVILVAILTITSSQVISKRISKAETENRRLSAIIGATTDFVGIFQPDGRPLYLNPSLRQLAGLTAEEEPGQLHFRQFYPADEGRMLAEKALPEAMASGQWLGETRVTGKDKMTIPVSQVILYPRGAADDQDWFAIIARDISEGKKIQAELEQFAYVASHDLKEPLRMVNSFMSLLDQQYSNQLDEKARSYIHFAVDGANRMNTLIRDLLEFSRTGRTEMSREQVNLNELMTDLVDHFFRELIREKNATVHWENLPVITGNKTSLTQLFQNLLSNALKYQPGDRQPVVEIRCTENADHWQFAVQDNGIGIQEEYFDKIFMIFQRLHNKNEYSGSGIGLSLCKKIVEQHNGKIWVRSGPGQGSTFYFTISHHL